MTECVSMFALPTQIVGERIMPLLCIRDLKVLDTAYSNHGLRPLLARTWPSYHYTTPARLTLSLNEMHWLRLKGVDMVGICLANGPDVVDIASLAEVISSSMPNLQQLKVYLTHKHTGSWLETIAAGCRDLRELAIGEVCSTREVTIIATHYSQLRSTSVFGGNIAHSAVTALCSNCPYLQHIDIESNMLDDASLIAIANTYPHLQSLTFYGARSCTNDSLIYAAHVMHDLRKMSLWSDNVTNIGLAALWAANTNLTDIDFVGNKYIAVLNKYIVQLVRCCPQLLRIIMNGVRQITDAAVIAVAEHCPQLASLNIEGCSKITDVALIALGQHCHELKTIELSNRNISDVGISVLATGCPLLQEFTAHFSQISDAAMIALTRACRDLQSITMFSCKAITCAAIFSVAENCPLISEIFLQGCDGVHNGCFCIIVRSCRNLRTAWCSRAVHVVKKLKFFSRAKSEVHRYTKPF